MLRPAESLTVESAFCLRLAELCSARILTEVSSFFFFSSKHLRALWDPQLQYLGARETCILPYPPSRTG